MLDCRRGSSDGEDVELPAGFLQRRDLIPLSLRLRSFVSPLLSLSAISAYLLNHIRPLRTAQILSTTSTLHVGATLVCTHLSADWNCSAPLPNPSPCPTCPACPPLPARGRFDRATTPRAGYVWWTIHFVFRASAPHTVP